MIMLAWNVLLFIVCTTGHAVSLARPTERVGRVMVRALQETTLLLPLPLLPDPAPALDIILAFP